MSWFHGSLYTMERHLKRREKLSKRHYALWNKFKWTDENTQKIFALNDFIMQKERELYDTALKMRNDVENHIKNGDEYYKTYDLEISLTYDPDDEETTPFADNNTIFDLAAFTDFEKHCFANEGDPIRAFEDMFNRDENYNGYDGFRECPDKSHYICRYMHDLIDYHETYTLLDLLYMKTENFFTDCTIHI